LVGCNYLFGSDNRVLVKATRSNILIYSYWSSCYLPTLVLFSKPNHVLLLRCNNLTIFNLGTGLHDLKAYAEWSQARVNLYFCISRIYEFHIFSADIYRLGNSLCGLAKSNVATELDLIFTR